VPLLCADNVSAIDNFTGESCVQTRFDDRLNTYQSYLLCALIGLVGVHMYFILAHKNRLSGRGYCNDFIIHHAHSRTLLSWRDAKVAIW
jgi:hypothetical protein